jgi:hypothetical protein
MCIRYMDSYSCGHAYTTNTVECLYGPCRIIEHRPGKKMSVQCARLTCRRSDWAVARVSDYDYDYERRSERRVVKSRDCGRDFGFREQRHRGHGRVDVDEHSWMAVGDGYFAAGHSRRTVRSGSLGEKSSVERFYATILEH